MIEDREKIGRQTNAKKKRKEKNERAKDRTRRGRDQNTSEACRALGTQWHPANSGAFCYTGPRVGKKKGGPQRVLGLFLGAALDVEILTFHPR